MNQEILLSIIIPVYNEASRRGYGICEYLESITEYFRNKNICYEIIVVNGGSLDNTASVVKSLRIPNLTLVSYLENRGKSFCVRGGLLNARGKYRLFADADGATPITSLDNFWKHMQAGDHIIIGSRKLKKSEIIKHQPKIKEFLGDLGNYLIQFALGLHGIHDTQCGFKVLSREVVERIVPQMQTLRWGGDFEILALGKIMGYKIIEIPITWIDSGQSTVGKIGYIQTLKELLQVKWGIITGKYYIK